VNFSPVRAVHVRHTEEAGLKRLAAEGRITPKIPIESEDGQRAIAKQVRGLVFAQPMPVPVKEAEIKNEHTVTEEDMVQPEPKNGSEKKTEELSGHSEDDLLQSSLVRMLEIKKELQKNKFNSCVAGGGALKVQTHIDFAYQMAIMVCAIVGSVGGIYCLITGELATSVFLGMCFSYCVVHLSCMVIRA
jgi:hypothetical protein